MAIEPNTKQTIIVPKEQAKPNVWFLTFTITFVVCAVVSLWLWAVVFSPMWDALVAHRTNDEVFEGFRNFWLSIAAAAAIIGGFAGLVFSLVRSHAELRRTETAETDSKLSEKKHQSEAFATAIEQLGHDNFAVRLGAVYALEALAKSSRSLHGPIFETLCAYVRNQAPAPKDDGLAAKIETRGNTDIREIIVEHLKTVAKPHVVVQAILTVAGRRDPSRDPQQSFQLDLQATDLRKADLHGGHFEGANLSEAHLERAKLTEAHFNGAVLNGAHLEGADLLLAHLEGADLWMAHLNGAYLSGANLKGAILGRAHLKGAFLITAHLEGTYLGEAQLNGADLARISFDAKTSVHSASFLGAINIPAKPGNDFRATVKHADTAQWPGDDDEGAWDRGE